MNPTIFCKRCNDEVDAKIIPRPDTPHAAEIRCSICGAFYGWQKKEKNEGKRPKNKITPSDLNIDFCQLCRRPSSRLGKNETLTSHHIIEIQEGGEDEPGNIWVLCSPCHMLVHHQRTYLNHHFEHIWEVYESEKKRIQDLDLPPCEESDEVRLSASRLGV